MPCDDCRESDPAPVGQSADNLHFHILFWWSWRWRKNPSYEMLELIGLLSDKTVGKPNSCQPPSGSRETRKIPLGHKFQLARLFGKKLKHGYSYVFKSRTSLQLSSWLWLEDDSVICTRAASTVGPAACSTRLLLTARNTRLASRKSGKEIQIFLMMTSTWPYNQHLGFSLRINKLFFFFSLEDSM